MNNIFLALDLVSIILFVVSMVAPWLLQFQSRKKAGLIFGGSTILFFVLFGITAPPTTATTAPVPVASTTVAQPVQNVVSSTTPMTQTKKTVTSENSAPTPTPVPNTSQSPTPAPVSNETVSQKNAVAKAIDYLNFSGFSHDGLVDQLQYDQFSHADAVYGADNSGADWNEQAAIKARAYMSDSAFSPGGLISQLEYDKFTESQAEYGATAVGL